MTKFKQRLLRKTGKTKQPKGVFPTSERRKASPDADPFASGDAHSLPLNQNETHPQPHHSDKERKLRFITECNKLDPAEEIKLAEQDFEAMLADWPVY
jgi:hypothetical protein